MCQHLIVTYCDMGPRFMNTFLSEGHKPVDITLLCHMGSCRSTSTFETNVELSDN
jgi:hypothetical protein